MKANFSLTKRFVPEWNGNRDLDGASQLVAVLSMPTVQDVFSILEKLSASGFKQGDNASLSMSQATQIAAEAGDYLPQYVVLENAEDFEMNDVIKYPPFFPLATELLFALVQFAQPSEADVKNSKGLPA